MSWQNFNNPVEGDQFDGQDPNMDQQNPSEKILEPKKLIDSAANLQALSQRSKELAAKILSDADNDSGLARQITQLNINELNKAVSKETTYKTEEDRTEAFMNKILNHNDDDILKGVSYFSVSSERKKRYDIYEQMLDSNYLVFRILRAYINGILIKNAQTKSFLTVKIQDEKSKLLGGSGQDLVNSYIKFIKAIIMKYKLQQKLQDILIPKTLQFGNYFIEIVDLNILDNISSHEQILMEHEDSINQTQPKKDKKVLHKDEEFLFESNFNCFENEEELLKHIKSNLMEASLYEAGREQTKKIDTITETTANSTNFNKYDINSLFEDSSFNLDAYDLSFLDNPSADIDNTKKFKLEDINKLDMSKLKDIHLNYISPRNVIIIEKDSYLYGYLIVEDLKTNSGNEAVVDVFKRFTTNATGSMSTKEENKETTEELTNRITKEVLTKVVHNIRLNKSRSFSGEEFDYFKTLNISDEALTSLKLLIYSKIKEKSKLKFRFLSPESVVNFSGTIDKFAPYGTSIMDPLVGPVKLFTLALMSSVVSRLSRAAVMRKWIIETGGKRNHKEMIEKTKSELKSKSITYDKINSIQNISEIVTDFRDMATVSINGQRYIDMEVIPMNDRGLPLNDLNDLKNDIVAAGGVPGVYLNLGETTDLRETLVHLNITFANDIIDKQTSIEKGLDTLFNNVFKKVLYYNGYEDGDFYISNYCNAKLNPPLVLQIQSDEAMITTVSNILNLLKSAEVPVDPTDIFKRYIPSMDWDELIRKGQQYSSKLGKNAIINAGMDSNANI
jgi:hypothetical protein